MTQAAQPGAGIERHVPVGARWRTAARTVTAGEVSLLVDLAWTRGPLHTDQEAAARSAFGALTLPGPLVVSIMSGLWASSGLIGRLERDHGLHLLAVLGCESRYRAPLVVGDTLAVEVEITHARASSSRPDRGVLTLAQHGLNQRGETVAEVDEHVLFTTAEAAAPA